MNVLRLQQPGEWMAVNAADAPAPGPGEALVEVRRIGICGTDIHAFHGRQPFFSYPRVLGHELGVRVLEVGDGVDDIRPGMACAVEPYLNCGSCISCRQGRGNCCTSMRVLGVHIDGGMAERLVLPAAKLHPSASIGFDALALVEPLAIGAHAVDRAAVCAGENVLVVGAGPIGLAAMTFARVAGGRVIALDVDAGRLEFCKHAAGVHEVLQASGDLDAALRSLCGGDLPQVVIDATGNPVAMEAAFAYPAHAGRLVFVGLFQGDVRFHDPAFHARELTLLASRNAHGRDFKEIIRAMERGDIEVSPWITHRADFADLPGVFERWTRRETGVVKAVVEMG